MMTVGQDERWPTMAVRHWRRWGIRLGRAVVLVPLLGVAAGAAKADPTLVDGRDRVSVAAPAILRDPGRALTSADLLAPADGADGFAADGFVLDPRQAEGRSLGFTRDAVWLRAELVVTPDAAGRYVLALDVPNFDRLAVWGSWATVEGTATPPLAVLGDRVANAVPARRNVAPIDLPAGRHTLWFRATTTGSMAVRLELWRPDALTDIERHETQIHTALTTFAVLLGLVALLLAAVLRSPAMLLYAGSALATAGYILMMTGLDTLMWGRHLLGTDNPFVWQVIAGVFGIGFLFAALPRQGRWSIPVLGGPAVVATVLLVFYIMTANHDALPVVMLGPRNLSLMILAIGIAASVRSRLAGYRPAGYLILGWLALAAGNVVTALRNAGIVPWTDATYYLPVYAPLVEMLLFGVMLMAQLRLLRAEKEEAQRSLMAALRRNEAELGERVAQRTEALDRANAALRDREAQLRLILEAAPLPILLSHATRSTSLYANHRARALLLGGCGEAVVASSGDDVHYHDPADRDRVLALLERDGVVENVEVEMRDVAGARFWALVSMVVIDYEGQPARLLAVNDISRHKQLEQELIKAKELADAAAGLERTAREAQRQFLAMITHEFRTPLAVISVAAQYLGLKAEDDAALERLARVGRAVRHMNGMIDACLLDDRIEGAGLMPQSAPLDLETLVRRVADAAQAAAPHHVVTIAAEGRHETAGDEQLLGMAFSNLMENAVKYSRPGSVVAVTLKGDGDGAVLAVADQGPGVPEDERDRIFEKYHRCAGTGRVPGAGLGLYLTRRIVTAHGGTVGVRNRPEGGALFTLRLPLHDSFPADRETARQTA